MRFISLFAALALLSACATAATTAPTAANTPLAPITQPSSRVSQLLGTAGRPNAPTRAEVERAIGRADIARQDGAGAALTYRLESCALLLLFTADTHNALRLAEAHPSARHVGGTAPTLDQCAAEAGARHN